MKRERTEHTVNVLQMWCYAMLRRCGAVWRARTRAREWNNHKKKKSYNGARDTTFWAAAAALVAVLLYSVSWISVCCCDLPLNASVREDLHQWFANWIVILIIIIVSNVLYIKRMNWWNTFLSLSLSLFICISLLKHSCYKKEQRV